MREMWVDKRFFDKKSFGCFDKPSGPHIYDNATQPVIVLTKEEWEKIKPKEDKEGGE